MTQYATLDAMIVATVKEQPRDFSAVLLAVQSECERHATAERSAARVLDRRVHYLRKHGLIHHANGVWADGKSRPSSRQAQERPAMTQPQQVTLDQLARLYQSRNHANSTYSAARKSSAPVADRQALFEACRVLNRAYDAALRQYKAEQKAANHQIWGEQAAATTKPQPVTEQ